MALQKTVDRDEHRTKKPFDLAQKKFKYQKKYNLLGSTCWILVNYYVCVCVSVFIPKIILSRYRVEKESEEE